MTTSFTIIWDNWSEHHVDDLSTEKTTVFRRKKAIRLRQYNGRNKELAAFDIHLSPIETNEIFDMLEETILEADGNNYEIMVCDGWHWELTIRHSGHSIKRIAGTVEAPFAGIKLESLIKRKLILYGCRIEPLLFGCSTK